MRGRMALAGALVVGCRQPEGELVIRDVRADVLDTTYTVATYTPPGAQTDDGAPWVLLLDGDVWTETAAIQLDAAIRRGDADPVVVVGLGKQAQRARDYTPLPADGDDADGGIGHVDAFFAWVEDEFLPDLEAETGLGGAREQRSLMGHSYGGLATTWALFHATGTWGCYGIASPALWWDEGVAFEWDADLDDARVIVTYGALEEASILSLAHELATDLANRGDATTTERRFAGEDHLTVAQRDAWGAVLEACR